MNKIKKLINDYYDRLINTIDINTEAKVSKAIDTDVINKLNETRDNYLKIIKSSREKVFSSLSSQNTELWHEFESDDESILSKVFKDEYFIIIDSIYSNDKDISIGKLIKINQYIPNNVLNYIKNFLNQAEDKDGFIVKNLDQDILRAYLLINEFDPEITCMGIQFLNENRKDVWLTSDLYESKSIFPISYNKIDLEFVEIQEISNQAFLGFDNLTELNLDSCCLSHNSFNFDCNLENLKILSISNNCIEYLESSKFKSLLSLEELFVSNNEIKSIDSDTFENLKKLKKLHLSKNCLKEINPNWFKNMPSLEILYLDSNKISHLENNIFSKLNKLKYLNISRNRIEDIDPMVFNGLEKIEEICYDFYFDLKTLLGHTFKNVKFTSYRNNVL